MLRLPLILKTAVLALLASGATLGCEGPGEAPTTAPVHPADVAQRDASTGLPEAELDAARADDDDNVQIRAAPDAAHPKRPEATLAFIDGSAPDAGTAPDAGAAPDAGSSLDAAACSDCCADGFPRGDASLSLSRVAPFTPSPEGVTVCPGGDVFVTVDGPDEIRRVPLDGGGPELYASLTGIQPAGIDCDERGRLFVAGFSRRDGSPSPPILMVTQAGGPAVPLPQPVGGPEISGLNGIVTVPGAGVFASDTGGGIVLRAREHEDGSFETTVAAEDVLGANGMMYDPTSHKLYLVISFLPAQVLSFEVSADGSLSRRKQELSGGLLTFFDGLAVDDSGTLYVADYLGGVVRRGNEGTAVALLTDPASFAFRGGTLLVTSYHLGDPSAEGGLYALQLGACGPNRWP